MKENKSNYKFKDIFCVINSKGGVGKSTVSMQVIAPALYLNNPDKKITVWEIDNNNKSNKHISSKYLKYESIKLDKSEMAINDIEFSNLTDPNTIHVVDTGGSGDATKILAHLKQVELTGLQYIIPTNEDMDQIDNIITIIDIIRQQDKFAKIYLLLNRCVSLTEEKIKNQFINVFGSKELGIRSQIEHLQIDEILFVENSIVYTLLKSHYKIAMLDFYFESLDLRENIQEYKVQWGQQGHEIFTANSNKFKFSNLVLDLIEKLEPIRKALL